MAKDPFVEFKRFRSHLVKALGLKDANDQEDTRSYPIGGEAHNLIDDDGNRLARTELHGRACAEPYHVDIRTNQPNISQNVRSLFKDEKYGFGNSYLYDESSPGNDREKLQ
jgi:hypothetical protein